MSAITIQHPAVRTFLKILIPALFYTLLVIFLFLYLKSIDYSKLESIQIDWFYVLLASIAGIASRYWGAYIWFVLLKGLGASSLGNKAQLVYVYAKSWLGRYIPGTAPWILGKIYFASRHGISKNKLAVSSLLEGGLQVSVIMTLSVLLLSFDPRLNVIDMNIKLLMLFVVICGVIVLLPPVFNRIISIAYRFIRKKTFGREHMANGKTILKGTGLYAIGAAVGGVSLFFIAKAVYPELAYSDMLFVIGVSSLAGAVSMIAIFAPSGLGVREGIQLALLSIIMPTEFALVVTIFTRLWSITIDLVFFLIARMTRNAQRDQTKA